MHLLAHVSREDRKSPSGPAVILNLSVVIASVPRWDQGWMLDLRMPSFDPVQLFLLLMVSFLC